VSLPLSVAVTVLTSQTPEGTWASVVVHTGDGKRGESIAAPWEQFFHKEHTVVLRALETNVRPMSAKTKKKRSAKQERKRIEGAGGRAHSGSGAFIGNKSDGSIGYRWRMENKFTTSSSYRVTLNDLAKLRSECRNGQVPVFNVDFQDKHTGTTKDSWVLVPHKHWERLVKLEEKDMDNG
jgi:hypothetical protein